MTDCDNACHGVGLVNDSALYDADLSQNFIRSFQSGQMEISETAVTASQASSQESLIAKCQIIYSMRRRRDQLFGKPGLFCDPAWDILLDLFMARLRGDQVSVTSVGIAACAPITTALRWLSILEKDGFVQREHDPADRRRMFVSLTEPAVANMTKMLESF